MPTEEQLKNRADWIAALRSGKYQQAQGCLVDQEDRMCCLGVACEIDPAVKKGPLENGLPSGFIFNGGFERNGYPELRHFRARFGIPDNCWLHNRCSDANDRGGKTFDEIADWLERDAFPAIDRGEDTPSIGLSA